MMQDSAPGYLSPWTLTRLYSSFTSLTMRVLIGDFTKATVSNLPNLSILTLWALPLPNMLLQLLV